MNTTVSHVSLGKKVTSWATALMALLLLACSLAAAVPAQAQADNLQMTGIQTQADNTPPALAEGVSPAATASQFAGLDYTLDLTSIFTDADGDALTYQVAVNDAEPVDADATFSFIVPDSSAKTTLKFTANDGTATSTDTYTVTLSRRSISNVSVDFTSQKGGEFIHAPQFGVMVYNNAAEKYGYTDELAGSDVSALDVLVTVHELVYGAEAFAASPTNYLVVKDGGIYTVFGTETVNFGFAINGEAPVDKTQPTSQYPGYPEYYFGLAITQAKVARNNLVEFFMYQDDYAMDEYAWFADESGKRVSSMAVKTGEPLALNVKGYPYGYYGLAVDETYRSGDWIVTQGDCDELPIVSVDEQTGAMSALEPEVALDANGAFTVTFAQAGTYYLAVQGDEYVDVLSSLVKVIVKDNTPPALDDGVEAVVTEKQFIGLDWKADLEKVFTDADGDALTYTVAVNGGEAVATEASYSYAVPESGDTTFVFAASDGRVSSPTYTVTLTQKAPTSATVGFTSQMLGAFLHAPQFDAVVANDTAEVFGYTDEVDGVSALDVLVAAHKLVFGDDFTPEAASTYLVIKNGAITTIFDEKTSNCGIAINGEAPADKTQTIQSWSYDGYDYLGLGVTQAQVVTGDLVEFFVYQNSYAMDNYAWFVDDAGNRVDSISVLKGEDLELGVVGYCFAYYSLVVDESHRFDMPLYPEDLPIVLIDENGAAVSFAPEVLCDEDGAFSVAFSETGTYYLAIQGDEYTDVITSLVKVTVTDPVEIDVTVTLGKYGQIVSGKDGAPVAQLPVHLAGKASYTIDDALRAAHEAVYEGGAEAGYASEVDPLYGKSLVKLWGDTSTKFGYQVNYGDVAVWNLDTAISDGDAIDAYILYNTYPDTEAYAAFDQEELEAEAGEDVSIALLEGTFDENFNMVMVPSAGASVFKLGGNAQDAAVTDAEGEAIMCFDEAGEFFITAAKTKTVKGEEVPAITAPAMKIVVVATPAKDVLREALAAEKAASYGAADDAVKKAVADAIEAVKDALADGDITDEEIAAAAGALSKAVASAVASSESNAAAAKAVADAIDKLPAPENVTADALAAVKAVLDAFNKLTDAQKALVSADQLAKLNAVKDAAQKLADEGLAKGDKFTITTKQGDFTYTVTDKKVVSLTKAAKTKKNGSVTVNNVKYQGVTYKITAIGNKAFKDSKLKKVTIGANVLKIGKQAFQKNKNLKTFTVGKNVKSIGAKAFAGDKKLKKIVVKSNKLTKVKAVKNALKGSQVKTVKLKGVKGAAKTKTVKAFKKAGKKGVKVS